MRGSPRCKRRDPPAGAPGLCPRAASRRVRRARTRPRLTRAACASRSGAPSSIVVRRSRVAPRVAGSPAVGHPGWRAPRTAARMPRVVSRGSCASCAGCRTRRLAYDSQTAVDEWRRSPLAARERAASVTAANRSDRSARCERGGASDDACCGARDADAALPAACAPAPRRRPVAT